MTKTKIEKKAENVILAFWNSHQQDRQYWHRDGVAAALRALVSNNEEWVDGTYMVKSEDILNIATELENP